MYSTDCGRVNAIKEILVATTLSYVIVYHDKHCAARERDCEL